MKRVLVTSAILLSSVTIASANEIKCQPVVGNWKNVSIVNCPIEDTHSQKFLQRAESPPPKKECHGDGDGGGRDDVAHRGMMPCRPLH